MLQAWHALWSNFFSLPFYENYIHANQERTLGPFHTMCPTLENLKILNLPRSSILKHLMFCSSHCSFLNSAIMTMMMTAISLLDHSFCVRCISRLAVNEWYKFFCWHKFSMSTVNCSFCRYIIMLIFVWRLTIGNNNFICTPCARNLRGYF